MEIDYTRLAHCHTLLAHTLLPHIEFLHTHRLESLNGMTQGISMQALYFTQEVFAY